MKQLAHFHVVYDPKKRLFVMTAKSGKIQDTINLTEAKFRKFIKKLKDPIVIGSVTINVGDKKYFRAYKEYLQKIWASYQRWLEEN